MQTALLPVQSSSDDARASRHRSRRVGRTVWHSGDVAFTPQDVVARLEDAGVRLDRGLTEPDVKRVEKKYGFTFGSDHRALLRAALPLGDAWLNWRHATPAKIRERLQAPVEGVMFDVLNNGLWLPAWGTRPDDALAAERTAREQLSRVPALIPLYGQRYLPAAPAPAGSPVFSVHQSDVQIYADDLLHYVDVEFGSAEPPVTAPPNRPRLDFWSDLAASSPLPPIDPA